MNAEKIVETLRHLLSGKKALITYSTGEIVEPFRGDAGLRAAVDILLGDDSDLIESVQLFDEPADSPEKISYIVARYPTVIDEPIYCQINAKDDDEADAIARSMTVDGSGNADYDLYRSVY